MRVRLFVALAIALIVMTTSAYAVTLSVTPTVHPDWTAAKMAPSGTSQRGAAYQYWPAAGAFNTIDGGINPFAMTCGGSTKVGTVQYGTDLFKGRLLADIVQLSYTVYMHDTVTMPWTASQANPHPEYGSGRAYGLELGCDKGDGNWRGCFYVAPTVAYNQWVTIDALTEGTWRNPVSSSTTSHTWTSLNGSMLATSKLYSGAVLAGETRNYADVKSVTGKTFNFTMGSRVTSLSGFGDGNWWQSWYNGSGYIGSLTIQFADEAEATTYQFVPEPGSLLALATGLIGFLGLRKRR